MAQDKFNAKADTTGLSSFLKMSTWKNSTTNLGGNRPDAADIRLKLLEASSGPPC